MYENVFYQKGFTHGLSLGIVSCVTILGAFLMVTRPEDYNEKVDKW